MVARVIQGVVTEGKMDEVVRIVGEVLGPKALEREGLKNLFLLTDRGSGQAIAISFWETLESMEKEPIEFLESQLEKVLHLLDEAPSTKTFEVSTHI